MHGSHSYDLIHTLALIKQKLDQRLDYADLTREEILVSSPRRDSRIARRDNRESQCTVYKSYYQKMYLDRQHFPAVPQSVHLVSEVQSECLAEDNSE